MVVPEGEVPQIVTSFTHEPPPPIPMPDHVSPEEKRVAITGFIQECIDAKIVRPVQAQSGEYVGVLFSLPTAEEDGAMFLSYEGKYAAIIGKFTMSNPTKDEIDPNKADYVTEEADPHKAATYIAFQHRAALTSTADPDQKPESRIETAAKVAQRLQELHTEYIKPIKQEQKTQNQITDAIYSTLHPPQQII